MSKALFVNGNLHGHINPTLPVVRELVRRGEEVWYFCSEDFAGQVLDTGAHFIGSGDAMRDYYRGYRPAGDHPFYSLLEYIIRTDRATIPAVLEKTRGMRFDYLVSDSILGGGRFLGQIMGLPTVCSSSAFAMNRLPVPERMMEPGFHPQLDAFYRILAGFCAEWGLEVPSAMDVFFKKGDITIVYTSREFQPDPGGFDDTFKFTGPSFREEEDPGDFPLERIAAGNAVTISLGTIRTDWKDFYRQCFEAFADTGRTVVLSIGRKTDASDLGPAPANFIVRNFIPQIEVLRRSELFLSHGGMNSVSEALYHGVPVVAFPMVNDQHLVARQLAGTGAGLAMKIGEASAVSIREAADRVLADRSFADAAAAVGASFRRAGGYRAAAGHILAFAESLR